MDKSQKHQEMDFDEKNETIIPKNVMVMKFAESRANEIIALNEHVQMKTVNKMVLETLPKHMHRRAMSHDIRRWPRRLREMVKKQYENRPDKRSRKPPSRKHRRRPRNLLAEYNRRKKKNVWLETHIWHAKRFHMVKKWGYHLALTPNTKSNRATYRSITNHCLMQDVSFLCCIEISGPTLNIQNGFSHLTNPATGLGVCAKSLLNGSREGHTVLFMYDEYPNGAIGPVTFFWKPLSFKKEKDSISSDFENSDTRCLWLWCHPSCYSQLWNQLIKIFHNDNSNHFNNDVINELSSADQTMDIDQAMNEKNISPNTQEVIKSTSDSQTTKSSIIPNIATTKCFESKVSVKSLKDNLVRFRLTGPMSLKILTNSVNVESIKCERANTETMAKCEESSAPLKDLPWWQRFYSSEECQLKHLASQNLWKNLSRVKNPAELPSYCVLGATVSDPRNKLPKKKSYAKPSCLNNKESDWNDQSFSPLWEDDIRLEVKKTKISEQEFNKIHSESLIPGYPINLEKGISRIPIILVQNPGYKANIGLKCEDRLGFGSGIDLILPSSWGMAFWVAFVYQGARVGGLTEAENLLQDSRCLSFPTNFPDTQAGLKEMLFIRDQNVEKYLKKPPAKRPNFLKLRAPCPYFNNYSKLVGTVSSDQDSKVFNVLRNRQQLRALDKFLSHRRKSSKSKKTEKDSFFDFFPAFSVSLKSSIVPVTVRMVSKGCPQPFSMICLPNKDDLKQLKTENHKDPLEPLLKYHQQTKCEKEIFKQTEMCAVKLKDGEDILLPFDSTTRKIIGFVNVGRYTYRTACGFGMGFCSLSGLESLSTQASLTVLIRSIKSQQYRFAKISVIL